jgi:hypothetical protein
MRPKRRFPKVVLLIASGFVVAAMLWSAFAVPMLVKYPTDLDVRARYAGTFTLFIDPATATPFATPLSEPLVINRHIRALENQSDSSRVVVKETIEQEAGVLVDATQSNVYVMDRRTMKNLADDRAYAFEPANVVDRSGAYRLNLPFDTNADSTYEIYKNETGTTYQLRGDATTPTADEAGLRLHNYIASAHDVPINAAYLTELNKVLPLPHSLTLEQLEPQLNAAGLDVDALLTAVAPVITAQDVATLARLAAEPIPLQYVLSFDGRTAVEPTTGAEVKVAATESVGARPMLANMATLQSVLAHYPDVPTAVAAGEALHALNSAPATKLFEIRYEQTPASVADIAGQVEAMRRQIRLADVYVPFGLWGAAALSLAVLGFVYLRRPRGPRADPPRTPPIVGPAPEREPMSLGSAR